MPRATRTQNVVLDFVIATMVSNSAVVMHSPIQEVDEEKRGTSFPKFSGKMCRAKLVGGFNVRVQGHQENAIGSIGSMLLPCHPGGESVFFLFNGVRKQKRATAGPARRASLRSAAEEHQAWPSFGVGALLVVGCCCVCDG